MENWHLFSAAFVLSLVDLSVLGAFLWYQFSTLYFAWHLCPMIVNRICELIAFMFTGGMLPSLFAIVQVPLSLFSTTIYANRQQHFQNKLLLAVYCTLLVYEFLVAVLMIKMGRYLKYPVPLGSQQSRLSSAQQAHQPYIAFHMFALFTQPAGAGCPHVSNPEHHEGSQLDGFVTVQQPDGKKVMLGKVLQSRFELPMKAEVEGTGGGTGGKDGAVNIAITPFTVPSVTEERSPCSRTSSLSSQVGDRASSNQLSRLPSEGEETSSCSERSTSPSQVGHEYSSEHASTLRLEGGRYEVGPLSSRSICLSLQDMQHCDGDDSSTQEPTPSETHLRVLSSESSSLSSETEHTKLTAICEMV